MWGLFILVFTQRRVSFPLESSCSEGYTFPITVVRSRARHFFPSPTKCKREGYPRFARLPVRIRRGYLKDEV